MSRLLELLEDDDKQLSCYRFCFLGGCVGLFGLAIAQFMGLGSLPVALYGILGTMASGGYIMGKYSDRSTDITPNANEGDIDVTN